MGVQRGVGGAWEMNGQVTRQQCLFVVCVVLLSYRHGRQQTMFALYNFVTHVAQRKTTGTCVRKNVNNGNKQWQQTMATNNGNNNGNKQWQQTMATNNGNNNGNNNVNYNVNYKSQHSTIFRASNGATYRRYF
jgi:hypothetical protein